MGGITLSSLNSVDIVILIIFALSILIGFGRGLVSELLSLLVLIAAFIIAVLFSNQLADFFNQTATIQNAASQAAANGNHATTPMSYMLLGVSFGVLFIGTIIIGTIIKMLLHFVIGSSSFGIGNRILGGLFGLIRGYLITFVLIFLIQLSPFSSQHWWSESQFVPYFDSQVVWLGQKVSPTLDTLKKSMNEKFQIIEEPKVIEAPKVTPEPSMSSPEKKK